MRWKNERTRAVVSPDGWKLCLSDVDKCQLFDLNKDPGETTNLFDSGQHKEIISRLTKKIHQWQETVGDTVKVSQNQDTRPKTQDSRHKNQDPRHKTPDTRLKTQESRLKTQDSRLQNT